MSKSKKIFNLAHNHIVTISKDLQFKDIEALSKFIENPVTEAVEFDGKRINITTWAENVDEDQIAVIVEARRERFLGWAQVTANGFYRTKSGNTIIMEERDLFKFGY